MSATRPLSAAEAVEIRLAVGRLQNGARELFVVAWVMPIFLAGAELAAEGFNAAGVLLRDGVQRPLDRATFVAFVAAIFVLAIRGRVVSSRAAKVLPDALSDDPSVRADAKARLLRLGGPAILRRVETFIAGHWEPLALALAAAVVLANLLPVPNPVWIAVLGAVALAVDVRWRAMVADAADQVRG